jgi:non-specific protein-tyrosine kinase
LELRKQISVLRAWWWLLLASVLLAGGAAFIVSGLLPKVYEGQTTLVVGQDLSAVSPDYNAILASQQISQTYAQVATTRPLLDTVIAQLDLRETPEELLNHVQASATPNNTLITITAEDSDPTRAAAIANDLANALIAASPALQGRQASVVQSVDADLQATQQQINQTQAQVQALASLSNRTTDQEAQLQSLQNQLTALRSTYASLLSFSSNNAPNLLSVVEPAVAPDQPSSPRPLLNTLLAAIVGLVLAVGIAFLVEFLDDSLKTADEVEEAVELPTLGAILRMKGDPGRSEIYRLATLLQPRSPVAEAYRSLRTNIEFAAVDEPVPILLVTSSIPSEGKTTTAANLAVAFAQAGRQVLLVDADLRKPGIHRILDLPNAHGLTTLLRSDDAGIDTLTHATEQEHLRVLTTGSLPPNPAELLGSQRFRSVLARLAESADLVILDSPPLQAVTDAAILAALADGTLLVVDAGRTRRGAVRQGREALAKAGARVLGVALNRLSERVYSDYYQYYGGYYPSATERGTERPTQRQPKAGAVGK